MISAVDGFFLGQMREHLDAEAAVEVVGDSFLPGTPDDLRGKAAGDARLGHDVIGKFPGAFQELFAGNNFIDHAVLQGFFGVNGLARMACSRAKPLTPKKPWRTAWSMKLLPG